MKGKKRKGFTLAEVVISLVIISVIVVLVGGSITTTYMLSSRLKELPTAYYQAQDQAEAIIADASTVLTEKYRLENEMRSAAPADITQEMTDRLSDLESTINTYEKHTATLFEGTLYEKTIDTYRFPVAVSTADDVNVNLKVGAVNGVPFERPVPIIDSVKVTPLGASEVSDVYFTNGTKLQASAAYNTKNYNYYFSTLYQWYICADDYHTAAHPYTDYSDGLYDTVIAQYPKNFAQITGAKKDTITLNSSFAGHLICCVATPLSKEGKMGRSVVSNLTYVSDLPELHSGSYKFLLDPSMHPAAGIEPGFVDVSEIQSRLSSSKMTKPSGSTAPKLCLEGAVTGSRPAQYSRYIRFSGSSALRSSSGGSDTATVFAVARSNDTDFEDFALFSSGSFGFMTNTYSIIGGEWAILAGEVSLSSGVTLGNASVDIAEFILAEDISSGEFNHIIDYLKAKYYIP